MNFVASGISHVLAVVGLDRRAREEIVRLHAEVHAKLDEIQARIEALSTFGSTLALFWGPSYTGLHSILREGCDHHLNELRQLRAELDHELKATDVLGRHELRGAAARLRMLAGIADDLQRSIRAAELFWEKEAQWTLDLLGARKASVWPPETTQALPSRRSG